jgi:hypothetical protein
LGSTSTRNVLVADPAVFAARTVKAYRPAFVGLPDTRQVAERYRPGGSSPWTTSQDVALLTGIWKLPTFPTVNVAAGVEIGPVGETNVGGEGFGLGVLPVPEDGVVPVPGDGELPVPEDGPPPPPPPEDGPPPPPPPLTTTAAVTVSVSDWVAATVPFVAVTTTP